MKQVKEIIPEIKHSKVKRFNITKYVAFFSTCSILYLLLVKFFKENTIFYHTILVIATGTIFFLLFQIYQLVLNSEQNIVVRNKFIILTHILLHVVLISYLFLYLFSEITFIINLSYALPVIVFFVTGRQTWKVLYEQFGSKMYQFFHKGNTAMLVGPTVLIVLGIFYKETFITGFYHRILLIYFTIHILLLGIAVIKIENDIIKNEIGTNNHSKVDQKV